MSSGSSLIESDSPKTSSAMEPKPILEKFVGRSFRDCFVLGGAGDVIGEGSFGTVVRKARDVETNEEVAVKCIKFKTLNAKRREDVKREMLIIKEVNHPSILRTICSFQDESNVFIVSELMKGGDLFDRIVAKESFAELDAKKVLRTLIDGVKYLHDLDIVHRDIKPENILLKDNGDDYKCVLCDFGFAKKIPKGGLKTDCGTENYVAPEILMGKSYGKSVDIWAIGVTMFMLITGYHPFADGNTLSLYSKVCEGRMIIEPSIWNELSGESKELVTAMLTVDVTKRPTIHDISAHPWLKE